MLYSILCLAKLPSVINDHKAVLKSCGISIPRYGLSKRGLDKTRLGGTPYNCVYGEALPGGGTFLRYMKG